jgi:hypothetical protein
VDEAQVVVLLEVVEIGLPVGLDLVDAFGEMGRAGHRQLLELGGDWPEEVAA